jgi:hypothetical protein
MVIPFGGRVGYLPSATVYKFGNVLPTRNDYFPLTLTLYPIRERGKDGADSMLCGSYTNDHFLTDTTKDEKWLVLVGRPSLAASRWRARRPAPPSPFHIKEQSKGYLLSF